MQGKTNAMRLLDKHGIEHECLEYPHNGEALAGQTVAAMLGEDPACVFKTLVAEGADEVFVFVIPVCAELDLKKAAAAACQKTVSMLPVAKLISTVGYMRGACTPLGMKKSFTTFFDGSASDKPYIFISGGRIGSQIKVRPSDIILCCNARCADIIRNPV